MTVDLISLAVIALVAALSPMIAQLIPGKPVPETVFLLIAGALLGPFMLGFIQMTDSVSLISDLGLAFLFLLAGYEINPRHLTGSQGKRGLATWVLTLGLAFLAVHLSPYFSITQFDGIAVAIALTTTALGTLLPILKERNLLSTRVGDSILAYGTYGELGPVIAMALLLSTRAEWQTVLILVGFIGIAVLAATFSSRAKKAGGAIYKFLTANANTTAQTAMRVTVLLLVSLVAISAVFDLDIVLGAFAAGFVLRYVIPDGDRDLEMKLDGIGYGFLIPMFFVASGAKINLAAVFMQPALLVGFILMLLIIRALPIFIALSTGKDTRDMSPSSRITVALYCTTALPVIVAVTSVAVDTGAMPQDIASVLVSAGAITVFLMPLLASITYRVVDAQPLVAAKAISKNPSDIGGILRDHLALERMLAAKNLSVRAGSLGRAQSAGRMNRKGGAIDEAKADDAWIEQAAALQERAALRKAVDESHDDLARHATAARASHADRVAHLFAAERKRRIEEWESRTEADRSRGFIDAHLGQADDSEREDRHSAREAQRALRREGGRRPGRGYGSWGQENDEDNNAEPSDSKQK